MGIKAAIEAFLPEVINWRQDFHRHPELGFEVHRTAAGVAELLRDCCGDLAAMWCKPGLAGLAWSQ